MSREPLIEADAAILPVDGPVKVCPDPDDSCLTLERHEDGYIAQSPDSPGEDLYVRFAPLIQAGGRQVFIAEAGVETGEHMGYIYGLARRLPQPGPRGATMQIAALDCEDLSEPQLDGFEAGGGEINTGKVTECQPVSLDQLKQTLLAAHRAGLADDAWWQAQMKDF